MTKRTPKEQTKRISAINKWRLYERHKKRLQMRNLTPSEYEREIDLLNRKLGF